MPGRLPPTGPDDPVDGLRAQRRLLLTGPLDHATADRMCAELMFADGTSADPIELLVNSPGGPVDAAPGLLDVIGLLRAPLATRCLGSGLGTAAVVVASGTAGRTMAPHATLCLRLPDDQRIEGTVDTLVRAADALADAVGRLARHLADVSNLSLDEAAAALRDGGRLSADAALSAGLVDEIAGR